jgi:hypothetical protein
LLCVAFCCYFDNPINIFGQNLSEVNISPIRSISMEPYPSYFVVADEDERQPATVSASIPN